MTCRRIETEDHTIILVAENKIESTPWRGATKLTHGTIQEADTEKIHEIPETHICLRATDKTLAMIHAREMDKDTIPGNVGWNNRTDRFDLSHLAMTGDKIAKQ